MEPRGDALHIQFCVAYFALHVTQTSLCFTDVTQSTILFICNACNIIAYIKYADKYKQHQWVAAMNSMADVTVITCTGGRPLSFSFLKSYIERQSYKYPIQWIVVDDYEIPLKDSTGFTYIRRQPFWNKSQVTLNLNLLEGLNHATGKYILFMEDDDWYAPNYIEEMIKRLSNGNDLVGNIPAVYYNMKERCYAFFDNKNHASLAQTGITRNNIELLKSICERQKKRIDIDLYKEADSRYFFSKRNIHLGIKGMPGRPGIGCGHNPKGKDWKNDKSLQILREWIGKDADIYKNITSF